MRKILGVGAVLLLCLYLLCIGAGAAGNDAVCINSSSSVLMGNTSLSQLMDGNGYTRLSLSAGTEITVKSEREIGGLYLEFCVSPGQWSLIADGEERVCGSDGYLHEYVPGLECHEMTLRFSGTGELCDLYLLSAGDRPDWVQDWQPCWDRADVMLLPTHSDDD